MVSWRCARDPRLSAPAARRAWTGRGAVAGTATCRDLASAGIRSSMTANRALRRSPTACPARGSGVRPRATVPADSFLVILVVRQNAVAGFVSIERFDGTPLSEAGYAFRRVQRSWSPSPRQPRMADAPSGVLPTEDPYLVRGKAPNLLQTVGIWLRTSPGESSAVLRPSRRTAPEPASRTPMNRCGLFRESPLSQHPRTRTWASGCRGCSAMPGDGVWLVAGFQFGELVLGELDVERCHRVCEV
jgi:hypothetical protein